MNVTYFKYALEVEKTASITQAANNLYMGQPNLTKAIKKLEASVKRNRVFELCKKHHFSY